MEVDMVIIPNSESAYKASCMKNDDFLLKDTASID